MSVSFREAKLVAGRGRVVRGFVIGYGQVCQFGEVREKFIDGCFARSIRQRGSKIALTPDSQGRKPAIGRVLELCEKPEGLHVAFDLDDSAAGEAALQRARRGGLDVLVGVRLIGVRHEGALVVRSEVALQSVSVAPTPEVRGLFIPRAVAQRRLELLDLEREEEYL
ncbi:HK97 family phage prohead protease [Mycolicibacterium palauense]|uniref:HK97 family phage prohead protease n=1 Tax=Mycolicibacterium palauense TaxID=2034511 RepID=UPI00159BE761|nr:HK97 family phage prohead protease [Mycolicibacterium palauense]